MRWPSLWKSSADNASREDVIETPDYDSDPILDTSKRTNLHATGTSKPSKSTDWNAILTAQDWRSYTEPRTLIPTVLLTGACIGFYAFYRSYLRRISAAGNISPGFFRKRSIFGKVTSVGDGDNFRIYHTPGGWLAGWCWLPWRKVPVEKAELKNKTIHVRLAGIDAPEASHFGRPAQPYSKEALEWLTSYVLGRRVRAYVYKPDHYSRVVATVYVWKWLARRDVGLQMLRAGLATVYEAKSGAEFGVGLEEKYRKAEWWAKMKRKGMWAGKKNDYESPREYKARYGHGSTGGNAGYVEK